jgi:hypothetical protein
MAALDSQQSALPAPSLRAGSIDWREVARAAVGPALFVGAVSGGIYILGKLVEAHNARVANASRNAEADGAEDEENPTAAVDAEAVEAAELLGVSVDASANEVRAALRAQLSKRRLHPDHGGDGDDAKRLIAAKNLLIERINGKVR